MASTRRIDPKKMHIEGHQFVGSKRGILYYASLTDPSKGMQFAAIEANNEMTLNSSPINIFYKMNGEFDEAWSRNEPLTDCEREQSRKGIQYMEDQLSSKFKIVYSAYTENFVINNPKEGLM